MLNMIYTEHVWHKFADNYNLSEEQCMQFKKYYALLHDWNQRINLTAITDEEDVLAYHFEDSLKVADSYDIANCSMIADIGTGGGLPGIPLKIKYPHLKVILVEVIQKKVLFLQEVITQLGLTGIEIYAHDWRSFLRHTKYPVNLICSRASLHPDELIRMFQPSSPYKHAQLIYWASIDWRAAGYEKKFLTREAVYTVGNRQRKYVFFTT